MRDDTRGRIVRAAMELFWEKCFQATSVADILARSGIHSGSLYHFFPGKRDVLTAVLEAYRDGIGPWLLQPAWAGVEDPIERIFALLGFYRAQLIATGCFCGCPIGSLALELHAPDPDIRALLSANFRRWSAAVETCLDAAEDRLPATLDRASLAEFVLSVMEGAVMQARTHDDLAVFDRSVAVLRAHIDMLMAAKGGQG